VKAISAIVYTTAVCGALCGSVSADNADLEFFLCLDSVNVARAPGKRHVYTYIDGEKTACMPKAELLQRYGNAPGANTARRAEMARKIRMVDSMKACNRDKGPWDYRDCMLKNYDFKDRDLRNASFQGANLRSADFRGADLRNADFRSANLCAAFLKGADLRGADFTGAALNGCYLNDADLRGIKGFSLEAVRAVRTLHQARMDTVFVEEIKYCCPDKLKDPGWYWHENEWADWRAKKRKSRE